MSPTLQKTSERINELLVRTPQSAQPIVLVVCGLAGAGKTTLCKEVLRNHPHLNRLSIDEIVSTQHGLYGVDYTASLQLYQQYQEEADLIFREKMLSLLQGGQSLVLDRAFYARKDRDEFRNIVEEAGGQWILMYLRVPEQSKEALWGRICERSKGPKEANSAFNISRSLFESYWDGFEEPDGEGEISVDVL